MEPEEILERSILGTYDEFVCAVPWGRWRTVVVHDRIHGGREYVRLRTWNLHRTKEVWYPSNRFFVIPKARAEELADALNLAADGHREQPPDWLPEWFEA